MGEKETGDPEQAAKAYPRTEVAKRGAQEPGDESKAVEKATSGVKQTMQTQV